MNICLFEKEEIGRPLSLRDERAVHILKILHKNVGDSFRAGILDGEEGEAKITKIEKFARKSADGKKSFDDGALYFSFEAKNLGKRLYPLKMIIGFPRPIQLKRLLRDMAGLGVCEIHLCGTDLGEKSYLNSDLADKNELHKLLLEGTVQAGGTFVPKVFLYDNLDECLRILNDKADDFFGGLTLGKPSVGERTGEFSERLALGEGSGGLTAKSENFSARTVGLQTELAVGEGSDGLTARSESLWAKSDASLTQRDWRSESKTSATERETSAKNSENVVLNKESAGLIARRENLSAESESFRAKTGEAKYFALDNVNPKTSLVQELNLWATSGLSARSGNFDKNSGGFAMETGGFPTRLAVGEESGDLTAKSENLRAGSRTALTAKNFLRNSGATVSTKDFSADGESAAGATLGEKNADLTAKSESLRAKSEGVSEISDKSTARTGEPCEKTVYAAIGSERGWSERERKVLESFGFVRCGLGSRILRTETAATVAATLILAKMNFL